MRLVIALGGNALLKRGEVLSADNQRRNMVQAAAGLARVCDGAQVAIVHGNGPQVGLLALEAEAYAEVPPYPLDVLGAESQGMIGYVIAQELRNASPGREVAALLTQTRIDPLDPAFSRPNKPIGPVYGAQEAEAIGRDRGWSFARDGAGLRRVVASPSPLDIVELPVIERLVAAGVVTVCGGGGGIPVRREIGGGLKGVEAVIDKDLVAALLATRLGAERLLILTDVDAVYRDWGGANPRPIRDIGVAELETLDFAEGSMAPKVRAACRFVRDTGAPALIGSLSQIDDLLSGACGTAVRP